MTQTPKETCETCRFKGPAYNPADASGFDELWEGVFSCRCKSPIATGGMMSPTMTIWPWIKSDDWCGEYEANPHEGAFHA